MAPTDPTPAAPPAESLYPVLEGFIETATAEEIDALFDSVKEGLASLKGPRAEYQKKVALAVSRTEELLRYLLQVREKLEEKSDPGRKTRR